MLAADFRARRESGLFGRVPLLLKNRFGRYLSYRTQLKNSPM